MLVGEIEHDAPGTHHPEPCPDRAGSLVAFESPLPSLCMISPGSNINVEHHASLWFRGPSDRPTLVVFTLAPPACRQKPLNAEA